MEGIIWIKDLNKKKVREVGLKAAYLGELFNENFNIPNGFVVSADSMKEFVYANNIKDDIDSLLKKVNADDYNDLAETSEKIQQIILNEQISPTLQNEILEAYENLNVSSELRNTRVNVVNLIKSGRGNAIVSVRGSAVIENLSFAGQQDSFLNVTGNKKLIEAVKRCWASLYSPRAIVYIKNNNLKNVFSGVIVQRMIDSEKSGIAFSANPIDNNRNEILIEAGFGLGQAIVDGSVKPDIYVIDKNNLELKHKIINKQKTKIIRDVNNNETVRKKIFDDQHKATLNSIDVHEIAKMAADAENHYGRPVNIEFGIEKKPYLLQIRDITTLDKEIKIFDLKGEVALNGFGISNGLGIGKVNVVRNAHSNFENGDVLVAESLNVELLPLIKKAKGVVVNEGGCLSNMGILCRELEVPVVVHENATSELRNGLIVSVDGYRGRVYRGEAKMKGIIDD